MNDHPTRSLTAALPGATMQQQIPQIGTAMEGGFFGGVINVNGTHKGIIWAPKQAGEIRSMLMPAGGLSFGAGSPNDCQANTKALIEAGSPAAKRISKLTIDGFQDWGIPSRDVLELGYRHFKPTKETNYCSWRDGENANSVPAGWLYTDETPSQTTIDAFRQGGQDSFDYAWYWSSTALPGGKAAFLQYFHYGYQHYYVLSAECRVRAVRLIQL